MPRWEEVSDLVARAAEIARSSGAPHAAHDARLAQVAFDAAHSGWHGRDDDEHLLACAAAFAERAIAGAGRPPLGRPWCGDARPPGSRPPTG